MDEKEKNYNEIEGEDVEHNDDKLNEESNEVVLITDNNANKEDKGENMEMNEDLKEEIKKDVLKELKEKDKKKKKRNKLLGMPIWLFVVLLIFISFLSGLMGGRVGARHNAMRNGGIFNNGCGGGRCITNENRIQMQPQMPNNFQNQIPNERFVIIKNNDLNNRIEIEKE